jgi:hypothetical protein
LETRQSFGEVKRIPHLRYLFNQPLASLVQQKWRDLLFSAIWGLWKACSTSPAMSSFGG